jgi:hypothetical protein
MYFCSALQGPVRWNNQLRGAPRGLGRLHPAGDLAGEQSLVSRTRNVANALGFACIAVITQVRLRG